MTKIIYNPVIFCTKCYYKIDNFKRHQVKSPFQMLVWVPRDMKGCERARCLVLTCEVDKLKKEPHMLVDQKL